MYTYGANLLAGWFRHGWEAVALGINMSYGCGTEQPAAACPRLLTFICVHLAHDFCSLPLSSILYVLLCSFSLLRPYSKVYLLPYRCKACYMNLLYICLYKYMLYLTQYSSHWLTPYPSRLLAVPPRLVLLEHLDLHFGLGLSSMCTWQ